MLSRIVRGGVTLQTIICKCVLNKFCKPSSTLKPHHVLNKPHNWKLDKLKRQYLSAPSSLVHKRGNNYYGSKFLKFNSTIILETEFTSATKLRNKIYFRDKCCVRAPTAKHSRKQRFYNNTFSFQRTYTH